MTPANDAAPLGLREALGLSLVMPEPEVTLARLESLQCKSLACLIVGMIAEHEPLLHAECQGNTVVVREIGGGTEMRFTIEAVK